MTVSHPESPTTTERPYLSYEYLPTYDMRFVLFNRLSVAEGLHDIGENRRWKSDDYTLSEIERSYMLQWRELSWQKIVTPALYLILSPFRVIVSY